MFYFLLGAFLLFYLTCHVVSEYKLKAVKAGEADLSILDKNKFFMCRTCKFCAISAFIVMILTGIILLFAPPGEVAYVTNWNLLNLSQQNWLTIHIIVTVLFVITFSFHLYGHWGAFVRGFQKLLGRQK